MSAKRVGEQQEVAKENFHRTHFDAGKLFLETSLNNKHSTKLNKRFSACLIKFI